MNEPAFRELVVARLRRPWGRNGELLVELHTDWPQQRLAIGAEVCLDFGNGRRRLMKVRSFRELQQGSLIGFEGVDGIGPAEGLQGAWVLAAGPVADVGSEDWRHSDLVGLEVVTVAGKEVGTVTGILEGVQSDLLEVTLHSGGEVLVPLAPAICRDLDRSRGRIVIDPPVGLLDPDQAEEVRPGNGGAQEEA